MASPIHKLSGMKDKICCDQPSAPIDIRGKAMKSYLKSRCDMIEKSTLR